MYSDCHAGFDPPLDCAMNATKFLPHGSVSNPAASAIEDPGTRVQRRPYIPKRPHRKSRVGCNQCKKRKVKCDEERPSCKTCLRRKEECIYQPSSARPTTSEALQARSRQQSVEEDAEKSVGFCVPVVAEPLFKLEHTDAIDMKMLWFYTTYSYQHFSINSGLLPVDYALRVKLVEHAHRSPFLMETLKALSALHLLTLGQHVPPRKLAAYQARAFQGYRSAIETAHPSDYAALLGCSLIMIAVSSHNFRDPQGKRLFVVDWIAIWRGIGLIFQIISPGVVEDSGLAALFYRPPLETSQTVRYIPNNLLFMVASIKDDDVDYVHRDEYYELLKSLGSLYMELTENGFNHILNYRIITLFSFYPRPLIPLARKLRPRVLVIIAYWLCFVKLLDPSCSWWMTGILAQAEQIFEELGSDEEWEQLLRVPKAVMQTEGKLEIARLILESPDWTPETNVELEDPMAGMGLVFVMDDGNKFEVAGGKWRLKPSGATFEFSPPRLEWDQESNPSSPFTLTPPDSSSTDTPQHT